MADRADPDWLASEDANRSGSTLFAKAGSAGQGLTQTFPVHSIWVVSSYICLTFVLLNPDIPCFANSVDPDQLASEEANWSRSALFAIKYANL